MSDYSLERERMVERQLKARGIRDKKVLEAFRQVPRHEFVPESLRSQAYADGPLAIGWGQTISQPYIVAMMTQQAEVTPGDRILEIGAGSGYQSAILAEMGAEVFAVERIQELIEQAMQLLDRLGYGEVHLKAADGTLGWEEEAPFDAIIVTAGAPSIPQPLADQLSLQGRLVIPIDEDYSQVLYRIKKTESGFEKSRGERCTFVPLIGAHGWQSNPRTH